MSDNEKRAHDFAIALLPKLPDICADEARKAGKTSYSLDLYKAYKSIYAETLMALNQDFPEGK